MSRAPDDLRLLSRAQETPSELPLWGCRKYLSSLGSTATLPEPSCWLVGRQERSAPSALPPRRTGYWTAHPPLPHTASSREAKLCSAMVHCIPSKTLGQIPLDVWRGPAPFAVWAEPAWSPRGGWVNKLTIRHPTSELERVWPTGPPATPPAL